MKAPVVGFLLGAVAFSGCASTGPRDDEIPRVPVYQVGEETPCEYEAMGRVVAPLRDGRGGDREYRVAVQRALGRAGAEAGADAVIVQDFVRRLRFVLARAGDPPPPPTSEPLMLEGTAVRWILQTCKSGTPAGGS